MTPAMFRVVDALVKSPRQQTAGEQSMSHEVEELRSQLQAAQERVKELERLLRNQSEAGAAIINRHHAELSASQDRVKELDLSLLQCRERYRDTYRKLRECQSRADQDRADAEELRNVILYAIDNPEFDSCVFDSMCRAAARATQKESEKEKQNG